MKYLKKFNTHAEYEVYEASGSDLVLPNVSYCHDENHVHYQQPIEIEYLESTGTQYIDTGFYMDNSVQQIDVVFMPKGSANGDFFFGNRYMASAFYVARIGIGFFTSSGFSATITPHHKYVFSFDGVQIKLIDNTAASEVTFTPNISTNTNRTFKIFANTASINYSSITRFYGAKIIMPNSTLDIIPVRVGQVGYLYDKVSGQLFGNAGTGNFILGPDV